MVVGEAGTTTFLPSRRMGAAAEARNRAMACMALVGIKRATPMEAAGEAGEGTVAIIVVMTRTVGEHHSICSGTGGISNSREGLDAAARMGTLAAVVVGEGVTALLGCRLRSGELVLLLRAITMGRRRALDTGRKVLMEATTQVAVEEAVGDMAVVIDRRVLSVSLTV